MKSWAFWVMLRFGSYQATVPWSTQLRCCKRNCKVTRVLVLIRTGFNILVATKSWHGLWCSTLCVKSNPKCALATTFVVWSSKTKWVRTRNHWLQDSQLKGKFSVFSIIFQNFNCLYLWNYPINFHGVFCLMWHQHFLIQLYIEN